MAAKNRIFTMTQGAYGTEMGFTLYDAADAFPITDDVRLFVRREGQTTNVIDGELCNTGGPFTIEGQTFVGKYAFTATEMDLAAGTYRFRFEHGNPPNVTYFPTDPSQWFGKLIINPNPM
jgi:hypothetical protein